MKKYFLPTCFVTSLLSSFTFSTILKCVNEVSHIQQLEGITLFALDITYDIIFLSFFLGYVFIKFLMTIFSMLVIKLVDYKSFHPTLLDWKIGYSLGRILFASVNINWGCLVNPMVEPYNDVCICRLFIWFIRPFSKCSLYLYLNTEHTMNFHKEHW